MSVGLLPGAQEEAIQQPEIDQERMGAGYPQAVVLIRILINQIQHVR
jgi:hypothetical protein